MLGIIIGVLVIAYTFVLLTTRTYVTYVYIIPMASVLIAYCDSKLTYFMYIYVIAINILSIYLQYTGLGNSDLVFSLSDRVTMWEIQIALLVLSGVFLSKSCTLIKKRDEILDTLSDDVCKDALTGVYNKKYIENNVHRLFATKKTKSVAFIDVDDFKKFNTLYSHNFGDEVLVTLCEVITSEIKDYEDTSLIRVGGDEFIIFSLDFNKEEFTKKLKEIVKKVSTTKIPFGKKKVGIEISVGVASSDIDNCEGFTELYNIADKRNGKAKKNGKNCVEDN